MSNPNPTSAKFCFNKTNQKNQRNGFQHYKGCMLLVKCGWNHNFFHPHFNFIGIKRHILSTKTFREILRILTTWQTFFKIRIAIRHINIDVFDF